MQTLDELKDFVINERIQMLLLEQKKQPPEKTDEEMERFNKGERFLQSLNEYNHKIMIEYIDQLIDGFGKDQVYLYKQGFCDGVNIVNGLHQMNKIE